MPNMVVTGTSSGLGLAIVVEARRRGWNVLGTVRRDADRSSLDEVGAASALLDITDSELLDAGAGEIETWCGGRLDCLVNNAGTAYAAPVEEIGLDDLRAQFEVNVVGHIAVTQALLPLLRSARGTIAMISSSSAAATPPLLGAYAASKRAIEALAEALDLELAGQGVRTLVVRPGPFETSIWDTSVGRASRYERADSRYADLVEKVKRAALDDERMNDPAGLARHTLDAIESNRAWFRSTFPRTLETAVAPWLPWPIYKRVVLRTLGVSKT